MVTPRWVATRTQPIAIDDAVSFLAAAADLDRRSTARSRSAAPTSPPMAA